MLFNIDRIQMCIIHLNTNLLHTNSTSFDFHLFSPSWCCQQNLSVVLSISLQSLITYPLVQMKNWLCRVMGPYCIFLLSKSGCHLENSQNALTVPGWGRTRGKINNSEKKQLVTGICQQAKGRGTRTGGLTDGWRGTLSQTSLGSTQGAVPAAHGAPSALPGTAPWCFTDD